MNCKVYRIDCDITFKFFAEKLIIALTEWPVNILCYDLG